MTPQESLRRDYSLLTEFLRKINLRLRLRLLLEFIFLFSSGILLILLGSLFVFIGKESFPFLPVLYSVVTLIVIGILLCLGFRGIFYRPSMKQMAEKLEEYYPRRGEDIINSLLLYDEIVNGQKPYQISTSLTKAHLRQTVEKISQIQPSQVVNIKKAFGLLRLIIPLLISFMMVLYFDPQFLSRSVRLLTNPFAEVPPRRIYITVEPQGATLLRGAPLLIKAKATGTIPDKLMLSISPEGERTSRHLMNSEGNGLFSYRIPSVAKSLEYQAYINQSCSPIYRVQVVDPPDIKKVRLVLNPPDYSGLPKEIKESGDIEALKGTIVNLEAWLTKDVVEGKLTLNQENEIPLKNKEGYLTGSFVIFYPGSYFIRVKDRFNFENPNPVSYQVRLVPDHFPEAEIISPAQDLEVFGQEVIPIIYEAKDDFGITTIRLRYRIGGVEHFITLPSSPRSRVYGPAEFKWDLSSISLTSGDKVYYRIEVYDNDSISGPKMGFSRSFSLSVKDERARAAKQGEEMEDIANNLLDLLADQLEEIEDKERQIMKMDGILKQVKRSLELVKERPERFDLEALDRNLTSLRERIPSESKERIIPEMERLVLLAEELAKKARMKELEALSREIKSRQNRLLDLLQNLKERFNPEGLERVMKELQRIEEILNQIMAALAKLATGLPDEFVNIPDLPGLDFKTIFHDLEELKRKLASGDIAGAWQAAQRLLQNLAEMMSTLGKVGAQSSMSAFDRFQGEMVRQSGELERILTEQKEILQETEKIEQSLKKRFDDIMEKGSRQFQSQLKETFEKWKQFLSQEEVDWEKELENILREDRWERLRVWLQALEQKFAQDEDARKLIEELSELRNSLNPQSKEGRDKELKKKFKGLSSRQELLKEKTKQLGEKLEMFAQLFPGMDTEILNDLRGAQESMGEAAGKLRQEDSSAAIPPEQEALRRLSRSQQAMQAMAQHMAMRLQALRWAYPLFYDPRAGWYYGPWNPQPTLPQPEVMRPIEKGFTGIDREEFELPSKESYQVPKIFREKIMEALKDSVPAPYQKDVQRYFRGITE